MARHWMRRGAITAAIAVFLIVIVNLNLLRPESSPTHVVDDAGRNDRAQPDPSNGAEGQDHLGEGVSKDTLWFAALRGWAKPPDVNKLLDDGPTRASTASSPTTSGSPDATSNSMVDAAGTTSSAPDAAERPGNTTASDGKASGSSSISTSSPSPFPTAPSKAIVMGRLTSEDTDWVAEQLSDWQSFIYVVNVPPNATSPTGLKTKINKSKEATPYLTYIIDHYPDFPDVMTFLHAHRRGYPQAWHTDARHYDSVIMLRELKLETVMRRGYVNLRCQHSPGCPAEIQPFRSPPDPDKLPEHVYPYVFAEFFNLPMSEVRKRVEVVGTPCCAQFAVTREQILRRPRADYEHYRAFIEQTHYDDDTIGRVMEYMWHIIFGKEAVDCEHPQQCACELYGRCLVRGQNRKQGSGGGNLGIYRGGR